MLSSNEIRLKAAKKSARPSRVTAGCPKKAVSSRVGDCSLFANRKRNGDPRVLSKRREGVAVVALLKRSDPVGVVAAEAFSVRPPIADRPGNPLAHSEQLLA